VTAPGAYLDEDCPTLEGVVATLLAPIVCGIAEFLVGLCWWLR